VLNSRLVNWFGYRFLFGNAIRTMHFDAATTDRLPMPAAVSNECKREIASCVAAAMRLKADLGGAKSPQAKAVIVRQIGATEARLDKLVYALYGLSDEEVALVEGKAGSGR
jgi:hypothetical protein